MQEDTSTTNVMFPQGTNPFGMFGGRGIAGSGLGLGIAGTVLGGLAILGANLGLFGRGNGCGPQYATIRDLDYERALTERDAKIGKLESQLYTDQMGTAIRKEMAEAAATQAIFDTRLSGALEIVKNKAAMLDSMFQPVLAPQVLAPSQAILSQIQARAGGTTTSSTAVTTTTTTPTTTPTTEG